MANIGEHGARPAHHQSVPGGGARTDDDGVAILVPNRIGQQGHGVVGRAHADVGHAAGVQRAVGKDDGIIAAAQGPTSCAADQDLPRVHGEEAAVGNNEAIVIGTTGAADAQPSGIGEQSTAEVDRVVTVVHRAANGERTGIEIPDAGTHRQGVANAGQCDGARPKQLATVADDQAVADRGEAVAQRQCVEIGEHAAVVGHHVAGCRAGTDGEADVAAVPRRVGDQSDDVVGRARADVAGDTGGQRRIGEADGIVAAADSTGCAAADQNRSGCHGETAAVADDQAVALRPGHGTEGNPTGLVPGSAGLDKRARAIGREAQRQCVEIAGQPAGE